MTEPGLELDDFVRRLRPRVVGSLGLYVGDAGVAEELADDALVRTFERWEHVRAMERPEAWVLTVAFNLARSRFRRLAAERRARARRDHDASEARSPDTDAVVTVRTALARLPVRQRQAVLCRYYLDLSNAEAAAVMGCAVNTVKVHLREAIAALRASGLGVNDDGADADG